MVSEWFDSQYVSFLLPKQSGPPNIGQFDQRLRLIAEEFICGSFDGMV